MPVLLCAAVQGQLTGALCHCKCNYEDFLCTQVYIDLTQVHCSRVQGKRQVMLWVSVQFKLTGVLCYCHHIYVDFLCIQVYINLTQVHCSRVQGKRKVSLWASVQFKLTRGLVLLPSHLCRFPLHTGVH